MQCAVVVAPTSLFELQHIIEHTYAFASLFNFATELCVSGFLTFLETSKDWRSAKETDADLIVCCLLVASERSVEGLSPSFKDEIHENVSFCFS